MPRDNNAEYMRAYRAGKRAERWVKQLVLDGWLVPVDDSATRFDFVKDERREYKRS